MHKKSDKEKLMDEYLKKNNIYAIPEPLNFDLRGYTNYLKENNIDRKNVPKEVLEMFKHGNK